MWRTSLAGMLAVLVLAACGSSQTKTTQSSSVPATSGKTANSRCLDLKPAYVSTEGATGHLEVTFSVRNVSRQTCRIAGYPSARLLDASGSALPMRLRHGHGFFPDTMRPPRPVVLAPGARARFGLSFVTNSEYAGARRCRTVARALAGMPGWSGSRSVTVSLHGAPRLRPCGDKLVVSPVYA